MESESSAARLVSGDDDDDKDNNKQQQQEAMELADMPSGSHDKDKDKDAAESKTMEEKKKNDVHISLPEGDAEHRPQKQEGHKHKHHSHGQQQKELVIEEQSPDGSVHVIHVKTDDNNNNKNNKDDAKDNRADDAEKGHAAGKAEKAAGAAAKDTKHKHSQERFSNLLVSMDSAEFQKLPRATRKFYKRQNNMIHSYREMDSIVSGAKAEEMKKTKSAHSKKEKFIIGATTSANVLLLAALIIAVIATGSIAIIASVLDAGLDLLSSVILIVTSWIKRKVDIYTYPQGRERIEPVGVLIFSAMMGTTSLVLIVESAERLMDSPIPTPETGLIPIVILGVDIGLKSFLCLLCFMFRKSSPFAMVLMQDQRNDVLLNSVAMLTSVLGHYYWPGLDPIGAILISSFTAYNWGTTCAEQVTFLIGKVAHPDFISQLTYVCLNHDERVLAVDTVRAFHFGIRFLVEIDVVLPPDMPMQEAHDIGQDLQIKVERIEEVERCFVHLDFESEHNPYSEHKTFEYSDDDD